MRSPNPAHFTLFNARITQLLDIKTPIIPARSFTGGPRPTFAPALDLTVMPVTFSDLGGSGDAEKIEQAVVDHVTAAIVHRTGAQILAVLVPFEDAEMLESGQPFGWGWTLVVSQGRVCTFQRVIFPHAHARPVRFCDQGLIYTLPREDLSAWCPKGETRAA